jgi:hypothetical protein
VKPKKKRETVAKNPNRNDKRVHVALPIRITYWDEDNKPSLEMACTYDISASGARISKLRVGNQAGEIVAVERGRNKAYCRIVWVGDEKSKLHGQIGLQCVEPDRNIWENELRDLDDIYEKVEKSRENTKYVAGNRRNRERIPVEGKAEIVNEDSVALNAGYQGELKDLSEVGCLVKTTEVLPLGTDIKLVLKVANHDLALKGKVKHSTADGSVGIEFAQIRKSDRQTLKFLLQKLKEQQFEDILEVEI